MKKKNKFLVATATVAIFGAAACIFATTSPLANLGAFGQTNEVWKHYSERMPGVYAGVKEYWASCSTHSYQFTAPAEGEIVDEAHWDTSEFAANDNRYSSEACMLKISDSAVAGTTADTAPLTLKNGFNHVEGKAFTASGYFGKDLDVSSYDYLTFGLAHTADYMLLFGGDSAQSDDPEVAITKNKHICLWQNDWYYFTLEKNSDGKWDAYVGKGEVAKRASASLRMDDSQKNATNLKDILGGWNWSIPDNSKLFSSEVYAHVPSVDESEVTDASIKEFYTTKQVRRVEQQDAWKSPIGEATDEEGHKDFRKFGSRYAIRLSAHYETTDPKFTYNKNWSEWRFNHVQAGVTSVSFAYLYVDSNTDLGNDGTSDVHTMAQWYGAEYKGRTMDLIPDGKWHVITVTGDAYDINFFVMKIYHFTGEIYISNLVYASGKDAANVTDNSIKEFYTTKQVRRVEQQDAWKLPIGEATNEEGHAEYCEVGGVEAIRLSAHYETTDPKFTYNNNWSEWRFNHVQAGVTSVSLAYLYIDINTELGNDGTSDVHTMAQWYGAAYQGRTMDLIPDGKWHNITVTGEAYDINFFVMKIYHFTGDIYISNLVYA